MIPQSRRIVLFLTILVILSGCTGGGAHPGFVPVPDATVRELRIFDGHTGEALTWDDLLNQSEGAQVMVLGEQHDDRVGHAVQRVFVQDFIARWGIPAKSASVPPPPSSQPTSQPTSQPAPTLDDVPGSPAPTIFLSMEMLDRSRQATVDDYLADLIDRDTFIERMATTKWRHIVKEYLSHEINHWVFEKRILRIGWPDWENNYQPTIDAAKEGGAGVIAANTPWLRYTSLANHEGYARLNELTMAQHALFSKPKSLPEQSKYRERFWDVMVGRKEGEAAPEKEELNNPGKDSEKDEAVHPDLDDEMVLGAFRAQYLMDTTMARSIANVLEGGATAVIHLVGQFHSDFNGGTVQQIKNFLPEARILTISMWHEDEAALREEDKDRADIVIYTGAEEE